MNRNLAQFSPKRILVCQQRQIGDVLLATPAIELLKARFPEAAVHVFTELKCEPVLRNNPDIAQLHLIDKHKLNTLPKQISWYRQVAAHHFDLVVDFQQLPRCQWVVALSRAAVRLSFPPRRLRWLPRPFYTHGVIPEPGYASQTKVSLLSPLGISWNGERPRLYLTETERATAHALLAEMGLESQHRLITVDPTHRRHTRVWPAPLYAQLIDMLADDDPNLRFQMLYGPGEQDYVRALRALCRHRDRVFMPPSMPELRVSAACIEAASLHIGTCSAPRHIAVAVGTPSCVIPGAGGPEWTYPSAEHVVVMSDMPCQPCMANTCKHIRCLTELPAEKVALQAHRLLLLGKNS